MRRGRLSLERSFAPHSFFNSWWLPGMPTKAKPCDSERATTKSVEVMSPSAHLKVFSETAHEALEWVTTNSDGKPWEHCGVCGGAQSYGHRFSGLPIGVTGRMEKM